MTLDEWTSHYKSRIVGDGTLTPRKKQIWTNLLVMIENTRNNTCAAAIRQLHNIDSEKDMQFAIKALWFHPEIQIFVNKLVREKIIQKKPDDNRPKRNKSTYVIWTQLCIADKTHGVSRNQLRDTWSKIKNGDFPEHVLYEKIKEAKDLAAEDKRRYKEELNAYKLENPEMANVKKTSEWLKFRSQRLIALKIESPDAPYQELISKISAEWKRHKLNQSSIVEETTNDTDTEEETTIKDTDTEEETTIKDTDTVEETTNDTDTEEETTNDTDTEEETTKDTDAEEETTNDTDTEEETTKDTDAEEETVITHPPAKKHTAYWHYCNDNSMDIMNEMKSLGLTVTKLNIKKELRKRWDALKGSNERDIYIEKSNAE
jgi:hypothetical protein